MKYLYPFIALFLIIGCDEKTKDFVTLSGKIENKNSDSLVIRNKAFSKKISVAEDGSFSDTLKVEPGIYTLYDGSELSTLFLKNGYDLNITLNTEEFDESISYSGSGAESSNFLAKKNLKEEELYERDFDRLSEEVLSSEIESARKEMTNFIDASENVDSLVIAQSKENLGLMLKSMEEYYMSMIALRNALPKGSPSPTFEGYENFDGTTTSLTDLKGKYVYVDVWATWCAPCKAEIPYLKELEEDLKDENIAFVSMSIDDDRTHKGSWDKAREDWKAMVADKQLGGIQIFAPEGWQSQFVRDYKINGIPRFILIDPEGNIVDPSAPRPSDPDLKPMLEEMM